MMSWNPDTVISIQKQKKSLMVVFIVNGLRFQVMNICINEKATPVERGLPAFYRIYLFTCGRSLFAELLLDVLGEIYIPCFQAFYMRSHALHEIIVVPAFLRRP